MVTQLFCKKFFVTRAYLPAGYSQVWLHAGTKKPPEGGSNGSMSSDPGVLIKHREHLTVPVDELGPAHSMCSTLAILVDR